MEIGKLIKKLTAIEGVDADLIDDVVNAVNAEKNKGVKDYKKKDAEVVKYKIRESQLLEKLGIDRDTDDDSFDFDEALNSLKTKANTADEKSQKASKLETRVETLLGELEAERSIAKEAKLVADKEQLTNALNKEFSGKIYGETGQIKAMILSGEAKIEDGNITLNGKPLSEGASDFLASNEDIAIPTQTPGGGSTKGNDDVIAGGSTTDVLDSLGF